MPVASPDLTVSIVNTNNRALLEKCLRSIFERTRDITLQVIVIDNASTDDSDGMVTREFPRVLLLRNPERLGFAASHNRALERGAGRYLLILNEDTEVFEQCFETLVRFMDAHPRAGACGPRLLNPDGSLQRTGNRFPTLAFGAFEALSLNRFLPNNPILRSNVYAGWDRSTPRALDAVSGAALLIRREAMAQIGLLDSNFFIYSEELDWCLRLHQRGWEIYYVPDARITHYGGSSTAARAPKKFHDQHWSSFLYYYQKHFGRPAALFLRALYEFRMFLHRLITLANFQHPTSNV